MLIAGSGSEGPRRRHELRLGHFAAGRWQAAARGEGELPEIFTDGEGLERGAGPVLVTLLHELADALMHRTDPDGPELS